MRESERERVREREREREIEREKEREGGKEEWSTKVENFKKKYIYNLGARD